MVPTVVEEAVTSQERPLTSPIIGLVEVLAHAPSLPLSMEGIPG